MTYDEAVHAIQCLPPAATARMKDAVEDADLYWRRLRYRGAHLIVAKAAAAEVSLIASGALLHIAEMR